MIAQAREPPRRPRRLDRRLDADDVDRPQRRLRRGAAPAVRRAAGVEGAGDRPRSARPSPASRPPGGSCRPTPAALVVIMSDIARGGLNQAVISIEQARGALSSALDLQQQLQEPPDRPAEARAEPRRRVRRRYTARKFPPRPTCRGAAARGCATGRILRADPCCHRPAVGGLDRRARRARRRRARVHGRLGRARPSNRRRAARAPGVRRAARRATGRRSARPVSSRRGGCWSSRPATPRTSTARPRASSPPARSGA